jgi:IclR family transcriptional regulator, acetate operon repressor
VDGPDRGGVQSLNRAFALLELMAAAGADVALTELAARSGLPLPTIHRIVRTLVGSGYVRQLPSRRYALGPRLVGLGDAASRALGEWARPHLAELVEQVGETASLAVLDGDAVVEVAREPAPPAVPPAPAGRREPAHRTGAGRALLAQLPPARVAALLARTGPPQPPGDPDRLARELDRVRHQGYAVDDAEQEPGVRAVAVAVPGAAPPTALSVAGPQTRLTWPAVDRVVPLLRAAAQALAGHLDARGAREGA